VPLSASFDADASRRTFVRPIVRIESNDQDTPGRFIDGKDSTVDHGIERETGGAKVS
jgi:hypothetical protein